MPADLEDVRRLWEEADCLFTQTQVDAALDRVSNEITEAIGECNPVILCVMKGGVVVCGCLLPRLNFPLEFDYVHASRYGDRVRGHTLDWRVEPQICLKDRVVLVVDDVLDEGYTLAAILEWCRQAGARAVQSAVLVDKNHDRKCEPEFRADFTALDAPDRYLFGYGLDYRGYLRNAPGLFALPEEHPDA